jgi:hypothetical protein
LFWAIIFTKSSGHPALQRRRPPELLQITCDKNHLSVKYHWLKKSLALKNFPLGKNLSLPLSLSLSLWYLSSLSHGLVPFPISVYICMYLCRSNWCHSNFCGSRRKEKKFLANWRKSVVRQIVLRRQQWILCQLWRYVLNHSVVKGHLNWA